MRRTITALAAVLLVVLARDRLASPIAEGLVHLGCLIIVGFVLGRLLEDLQVPKAAGFALAGFILGPDVAGVIGAFGGVVQSAGMVFLAWVGFCVGTRFKVSVPYVNWQLVTLVVFVTLGAVVVTAAGWRVATGLIYITPLLAVSVCFCDPFWAFAATSEAAKRTREGVLRAAVMVGMASSLLCWAVAVGAIKHLDGASLGESLAPLAQLGLSIGAGLVWGELVYHFCGVLRSHAAVLSVFLVSVLGVLVAGTCYPLSLLVQAVCAGIWAANRGARAEFVIESILPTGFTLVDPLFAIFGLQIPLTAVVASATWPVLLVFAVTVLLGRMGALALTARLYRPQIVSARYLGFGALLQGVVLLEMVRWTQANLAESLTFAPASELFVGVAGMGMMAGALLLPICTAWVWAAERRK